jgi:hypothetical protein
MLFGYPRVFTADQNPAHQIDALTRAGDVDAKNIHVDIASGTKVSRPHWDILNQRLRDGDTLTSLDSTGSAGPCCIWSPLAPISGNAVSACT